jgi:hypothetical protein
MPVDENIAKKYIIRGSVAMSEKNILNKFKQGIGEYCAINQFIELSKRSFLADHSDLLTNKVAFIQYAKNNGLSLTCYNSDRMLHTMSLSYIININLCFETFLKNLYQIIKLYGYETIRKKEQNNSWLDCIVLNIYDTKTPTKLHALCQLCNYYRLIRNRAVHDLERVENYSKEFENLKQYNYNTDAKFSKLHAPNPYEKICFDDFVMFSRSCIELANQLYNAFDYDINKIIVQLPVAMMVKWKTYDDNRLKAAITLYLSSHFPKSKINPADVTELLKQVRKA